MSLPLLLEFGWKSVLCAGVALLLLRLFRHRSAAEKSVIANAALMALILLPLGMMTLPDIEITTPATIAPMALEVEQMAGAFQGMGGAGAASLSGPDFQALALWLYLLPACFLLIGSVIAIVRLRLIHSRAELLIEEPWLAALGRAQQRFGLKHGVALLISDEIKSPLSWGVVRPIIIIDPKAAEDRKDAEAIIAHELAHVVRLDWLRMMIGRLATAIFWFNPLVWLLARRSHHLCEESADDIVLNGKVDNTSYAELLLKSARHANEGRFLAANGVAPSRTSLSERIVHVLDGSCPRDVARAGWVMASLALAIMLNAALAAAEPVLKTQLILDGSAGEAAARELDNLDTPQSRAIGAALRSGDWNARKAGGGTPFDDPGAVAPLVSALADSRPSVRRIAIWGLSELGEIAAVTASAPITPLLQDEDPYVRAQAARALGEFGAKDQTLAIARLLRDEAPQVRLDAAHALGDLQDPAAAPALNATLSDPDPQVRAKAGWALTRVEEAKVLLDRFRSR